MYFLTVMAYDLKNSSFYFDSFIEKPKSEAGFNYVLNMGYIFVIDKLLGFSDLPPEYIPRLMNLNKIIFTLEKMTDKCETNKNLREQTKQFLIVMYRESLSLMLDEIERCGFSDKLKNLSGENLKTYIKFILDIEKAKLSNELTEFFEQTVKKAA